MTSEYTHNDDVADLLHATEKHLDDAVTTRERMRSRYELMEKKHDEVHASWLASNAELADAKADIAKLELRLLYARTELNRLENEHARGF